MLRTSRDFCLGFLRERKIKMRRFGFKIFSNNLQNNLPVLTEIEQFVRQHRQQTFIEMMVLPDTTEEDIRRYAERFAGITVTIHAPHHIYGFDPARRECEKSNREMLALAQRAADVLHSDVIVVHSGCGKAEDKLAETMRQFKIFAADKRVVVENLPYDDDNNEPILHGNTAAEIAKIRDFSGCGFCFDFSHAICAANSLGLDVEKQLAEFYNLNPTVYHMCDGTMNGKYDSHLHFGEGDYPLAHFLCDYTAADARITMETGSGKPNSSLPWLQDYDFVQKILQEK